MFTLVDPPGISVSAGTADYDLGSKTITWQLGTISQSNPNTNPATMSYTVQISEDAESGVLYPTNEEAFVDYKNVFDEDSKQYFPIPEVMIEIEDITIRKLVSGNFGDRSREFPFDVTVTSSIEGYPKNYNFDLSHEGEFILYKLPKDAVIKLKETNAFGHSVIVTATGINGTIGSDENGIYTVIVADLTGDKTITVTNQNDVIIDTGISLDSLPYIIILALVAAGIAVLIIRRRKLSSED
ncbi:MAG: hypothetical protein GX957_01180 [Clostridiaceae bacterium]|nr:hypothetical protein [Clostridiaceae bacterium]